MELAAVLVLATLAFLTSAVALFVVVKVHIKVGVYLESTQSLPVPAPFSTDLAQFSNEIFDGVNSDFTDVSSKIKPEDLV